LQITASASKKAERNSFSMPPACHKSQVYKKLASHSIPTSHLIAFHAGFDFGFDR